MRAVFFSRGVNMLASADPRYLYTGISAGEDSKSVRLTLSNPREVVG